MDAKIFNIHWYYYLEFLIVPSFLAILIISGIEGEFYGLSLTKWVNHFIRTGLFTIVIYVAMRRYAGKEDFYSKFLLHMALVVSVAITFGVMVPSTGINESQNPPIEAWLAYIPIFVIMMVIFVGIFFITYSLNKSYLGEISKVAEKISEGDLSARIESEYYLTDTVYGPISKLINDIISYSDRLISTLTLSSQTMLSSSENLSASAEEVSVSTEQVSQTSQSMAHSASHQAEMIGEIVEELIRADDVLNQIINKIEGNTEKVRGIALQTNILALNAGIEASRAGDYGRGFAVVAENVRKLSDESKLSADEITEVISEISSTMKDFLNQINNKVRNVLQLAENTASSSQEISAVSTQVASNMNQLTKLANELSKVAHNANETIS